MDARLPPTPVSPPRDTPPPAASTPSRAEAPAAPTSVGEAERTPDADRVEPADLTWAQAARRRELAAAELRHANEIFRDGGPAVEYVKGRLDRSERRSEVMRRWHVAQIRPLIGERDADAVLKRLRDESDAAAHAYESAETAGDHAIKRWWSESFMAYKTRLRGRMLAADGSTPVDCRAWLRKWIEATAARRDKRPAEDPERANLHGMVERRRNLLDEIGEAGDWPTLERRLERAYVSRARALRKVYDASPLTPGNRLFPYGKTPAYHAPEIDGMPLHLHQSLAGNDRNCAAYALRSALRALGRPDLESPDFLRERDTLRARHGREAGLPADHDDLRDPATGADEVTRIASARGGRIDGRAIRAEHETDPGPLVDETADDRDADEEGASGTGAAEASRAETSSADDDAAARLAARRETLRRAGAVMVLARGHWTTLAPVARDAWTHIDSLDSESQRLRLRADDALEALRGYARAGGAIENVVSLA